MEGSWNQVAPIISEYVKNKSQFVYLEIGVAHCFTLRNSYDIIKNNIKTNDWICLGLDLEGSLDVNFKQISEAFNNQELVISTNENSENVLQKISSGKYHAGLILRKNTVDFINKIDENSIDFYFEDSCHGKPCFIKHFLAMEGKIKSGGLFMAHDTGEEETGTDWQPHCNSYIDVRGGLTELGLLNNSRKGWKMIGEFAGTRKTENNPNGGNSIALFQKL